MTGGRGGPWRRVAQTVMSQPVSDMGTLLTRAVSFPGQRLRLLVDAGKGVSAKTQGDLAPVALRLSTGLASTPAWHWAFTSQS